jgi:hypothetical protein
MASGFLVTNVYGTHVADRVGSPLRWGGAYVVLPFRVGCGSQNHCQEYHGIRKSVHIRLHASCVFGCVRGRLLLYFY